MLTKGKLSLFVFLSATSIGLSGCGLNGGVSVAQNAKSSGVTLTTAMNNSTSQAFQEDVRTDANGVVSSGPACTADAAWGNCIVDRLNQRLTDLQTLQTQIQNSSSTTESCWTLMQTVERGHATLASCAGSTRQAPTSDPAQPLATAKV